MTIDDNAVIEKTEIIIIYDCKCVENGEGYLVHRGAGGLS